MSSQATDAGVMQAAMNFMVEPTGAASCGMMPEHGGGVRCIGEWEEIAP